MVIAVATVYMYYISPVYEVMKSLKFHRNLVKKNNSIIVPLLFLGAASRDSNKTAMSTYSSNLPGSVQSCGIRGTREYMW